MERIAVYGTLYNVVEDILKYDGTTWCGLLFNKWNVDILGKDKIKGYKKIDFGLPYAIPDENSEIEVWVIEVPIEFYRIINEIEVEAGYTPVKVNTKYGKATMYAYLKDDQPI